MQSPAQAESDRLDEITKSVRRARESISLAGALAHSDPDDAWNAVVEAKDHCSSALAHLALIRAGSDADVESKIRAASQMDPGSRSASQIYSLIELIKESAQASGTAVEEPEARPDQKQRDERDQAMVIDHVANLCRQAVEEGVAAHDLAAQISVRDTIWHSVLSSVEAIYALTLIGAKLRNGTTLDDAYPDLAALRLSRNPSVPPL